MKKTICIISAVFLSCLLSFEVYRAITINDEDVEALAGCEISPKNKDEIVCVGDDGTCGDFEYEYHGHIITVTCDGTLEKK